MQQQMELQQLERRWAAEQAARLAALAAAAVAAARLLAAVHRSRRLALQGLSAWAAAVQQRRQAEEEGDAVCARRRLRHALHAWQRCRAAAAWRGLAADACAVASAQQQHHRALQRRALAALKQQVAWARSLPSLHAAHLALAALRCWRSTAAEQAGITRQLQATATAFSSRGLARRALGAWRQGAAACRRERLVAQRKERRMGDVSRYLAEHRAAKAAAAAAQGGSGEVLAADGSSLTPPSSAENSFDPNAWFSGGGGSGGGTW